MICVSSFFQQKNVLLSKLQSPTTAKLKQSYSLKIETQHLTNCNVILNEMYIRTFFLYSSNK